MLEIRKVVSVLSTIAPYSTMPRDHCQISAARSAQVFQVAAGKPSTKCHYLASAVPRSRLQAFWAKLRLQKGPPAKKHWPWDGGKIRKRQVAGKRDLASVLRIRYTDSVEDWGPGYGCGLEGGFWKVCDRGDSFGNGYCQ
jgi:hypothetical protein